MNNLENISIVIPYKKNLYLENILHSIKDKFIHCYSNQNNLLDKHGINENNIVNKIKKIINQK